MRPWRAPSLSRSSRRKFQRRWLPQNSSRPIARPHSSSGGSASSGRNTQPISRSAAIAPSIPTIGSLEKAWEESLAALETARADLREREEERPRVLSAEERNRVATLGADLADVWNAATTTPRDRKELLGTLIEEVILKVERAKSAAHLTIRWKGGALTDIDLALPVKRQATVRTDEDTVALVRRLAEHHLGLLANPAYAGTYVFGRYQSCKEVAPTGEITTVSRPMPQEQWRVTIPDHHPGYVSRKRFLANRQRLAANKTNTEVISGPAREGHCLLQGMLVCGSCGRRLTVRYTGNGGLYPIYECNWHRRAGLTRTTVPEGHSSGTYLTTRAAPIDAAISERLLAAVTPVTIELALKALESLEERDRAVAAQWHRRIERARYEADLAERRYEAVDPANRLIAATLENRWNEALQRVAELEDELKRFESKALRTITAEQKQQILARIMHQTLENRWQLWCKWRDSRNNSVSRRRVPRINATPQPP